MGADQNGCPFFLFEQKKKSKPKTAVLFIMNKKKQENRPLARNPIKTDHLLLFLMIQL